VNPKKSSRINYKKSSNLNPVSCFSPFSHTFQLTKPSGEKKKSPSFFFFKKEKKKKKKKKKKEQIKIKGN
jgi:hypothetical protein